MSLSTVAFSQEFEMDESFFIGSREVVPSLTLPIKDFSESKLTLREVNFNKPQKREVNITAVMQRERYNKENSYIELDAPTPTLNSGEKSLIQATNEFRIHDRSSNFDLYTGEKKIPAYEEMRSPLNRTHFSPYNRSRVRGYISPYYGPYLR